MPVFRKGERKFLFIHIPKTGGSSIEQAFIDGGYGMLYRDGRMGKKSWNHIRQCTPQHMHRDMLESLFRIDRFDGVFTIVREPLARLKSEYIWRHRHTDLSVDGASVEKWAGSTFARYKKDPFIFDNHIRPQVDFLLERGKVFRFEDGLDNIAETLNATWDIGLPTQLPRVREGSALTSYSSKDVEVTAKLRKLVHNFYGDDHRKLGYRG